MNLKYKKYVILSALSLPLPIIPIATVISCEGWDIKRTIVPIHFLIRHANNKEASKYNFLRQ